MEGRQPGTLRLEMWTRPPEAVPVDAGVVFANAHRDRVDLPRTLPEFDTLVVVEDPPADAGAVPASRNTLTFARTPRPGQGSLTDEPTNGLQLVLISPKDPDRAQELRDWGDFVHIRHIAEAAVPGFRMITPYVNVAADGPRFLHLYEMHTDDPEAAFQAMTPRVAERLGGTDTATFAAWAWHPQLQIDYVNTFRRVR
ncbi:MAG: hypothetical protein R2707_06785 [Acidimicrobiales bacterium]